MDFEERCRHFVSDRPCRFHKADGRPCVGCDERRDVVDDILIIKLDAMGDVLRTTAVLPALAAKHPDSGIVWITAPQSTDLLKNHPNLREVWGLDPSTVAMLSVRKFSRCINLDLGPDSLALASLAKAEERFGYNMGPHGEPVVLHPEAREWYEMSHCDDLKKANARTYQEHMFAILGLPWDGSRIVVNCPESEKAYGRAWFAKEVGRIAAGPVVGLNIGAGGRWRHKEWPIRRYRELALLLREVDDATILLLGGENEREAKSRLLEHSMIPMYDAGSDNSLPRFAALMDLCDVVVTGDTLGLHMALGLGKRTVALFGPTSAAEIEMYGLGEKLAPTVDCLGCYRQECDRRPTCMEMIAVDAVDEAVRRQIALSAWESRR